MVKSENKYELLFKILKPKIGPDCARIIIYDVYDDDCKKLIHKTLKLSIKGYWRSGNRKFYKFSHSVGYTYIIYSYLYLESNDIGCLEHRDKYFRDYTLDTAQYKYCTFCQLFGTYRHFLNNSHCIIKHPKALKDHY